LRCDQAAAIPLDQSRPTGVAGVVTEKIDPKIAIPACDAAAKAAPNDPRVAFQLGRAYLAAKEYESARAHFKFAADQGNAGGQNGLGRLYANALGGLAKDDPEAARLFKLAADQGNADGQVSLGVFYVTGRGDLEKDEREAARLYRLAADQGAAAGQNDLGRFYARGRGGLAKDDREAARLYKLAADQGAATGQANLGNMYRDGRGGLAKDDGEAARLYKLAADQSASGRRTDSPPRAAYFTTWRTREAPVKAAACGASPRCPWSASA
jgi:TPR repeat protein